MIQIGRIQTLTVKRLLDFGIVLDGGESGDVILSKKSASKMCRPGDDVEVFVYADKDGRLRATTEKPTATVGQFAKLRVAASASAGAYLDWGLQKDLLAPKTEQKVKMEEGKSYVVYVFLEEKTNRIAASSKLDKFVDNWPANYEEGEEVDIFICKKTDLGYKAVINNAHWGMIYENEVFQKVHVGQRLKGYIKTIRSDQKIDLSLQKSGPEQVTGTSKAILKTITDLGGSISVSDKSSPDEISALFGVSKKTFKKAIGALYKRRLITITPEGIKLAKK